MNLNKKKRIVDVRQRCYLEKNLENLVDFFGTSQRRDECMTLTVYLLSLSFALDDTDVSRGSFTRYFQKIH